MHPELIRATLAFLQRTPIQGGEAMVMVQVCQALDDLMRQERVSLPKRLNGAAESDSAPAPAEG